MPVKKAAASRLATGSNGSSTRQIPTRQKMTATPRHAASSNQSDEDGDAAFSEESESDGHQSDKPQVKRRKVGNGTSAKVRASMLHEKLFDRGASKHSPDATCAPPARNHSVTYHRPLLLDASLGLEGRESLLQWFDGVSSSRSMPWRKPWIDPTTYQDKSELRQALEKRAYEVWISEIMLQQTRVSTVIDYWNRWMAKWSTIQDLAAADPDDVLAAWRGLGYYSRATRIHQAAKHVVSHAELNGLLPEDVKTLQSEVPGVGRYTAGAVSAIVFGRPEPMVDGNVLRVLSRQLGLLANAKTDKTIIDTLWAAADALVKEVGMGQAKSVDDPADKSHELKSDRPGRWGQALMELGSTVCTPKPNCSLCPITSTCRAYQEGKLLSTGKSATSLQDLEDACDLCDPDEDLDGSAEASEASSAAVSSAKEAEPSKKTARQSTLAAFAFTRQNSRQAPAAAKNSDKPSASQLETIANHAKKFPVKVIKKAVRQEENLVCVIRRRDGLILIHRRPEKGLLAGLWEFPSYVLNDSDGTGAKKRKELALEYVNGLLETADSVKHVGELDSLPWLFSHIKLTMHVHLFEVHAGDKSATTKRPSTTGQKPSRWSDNIDAESMGTGMRKCWDLVQKSEKWLKI